MRPRRRRSGSDPSADESSRPSSYDPAMRSGLIIEVPEAERAVAEWRAQLDRTAALGVPAHVTVLFPFAEPAAIDESMLAALRALFATVVAFEFRLARSAWFDDRVVWLAPEPAEPFRRLTGLVSAAFPAYPPYEGQFADIVPHVTVGDHGAPDQLLAAERGVLPYLPISAVARSTSLMVERPDGRWERRATFALGGTPK